jgi:hypothetical protein
LKSQDGGTNELTNIRIRAEGAMLRPMKTESTIKTPIKKIILLKFKLDLSKSITMFNTYSGICHSVHPNMDQINSCQR